MHQQADQNNVIFCPPNSQRRYATIVKSPVPKSFLNQVCKKLSSQIVEQNNQRKIIIFLCTIDEGVQFSSCSQCKKVANTLTSTGIHQSNEQFCAKKLVIDLLCNDHINNSFKENGSTKKTFGGGYASPPQSRPPTQKQEKEKEKEKEMQMQKAREKTIGKESAREAVQRMIALNTNQDTPNKNNFELSNEERLGLLENMKEAMRETCKTSQNRTRIKYVLIKKNVERSFELKQPLLQKDASLISVYNGQSKLKINKSMHQRISMQKHSSDLKQVDQQQFARKIIIEKNMLKMITAKSFIIICEKSKNIVFSRKSIKEREIASLTKIMTCLIACQLIKREKINPATYQVTVSKKATNLTGTTAELRPGDELTLLDLLYGMMLPSGNDAAYCVADVLGRHIKTEEKVSNQQQSIRQFIQEMNRFGLELKLETTNFANPHGLANSSNYSSANDVALLIQEAMKDELFQQIVKTTLHKCLIRNKKTEQTREVQWENTNKLLSRKDCYGVKTGNTPIAGPCLAACFRGVNYSLIIILLKASGVEERFTEIIHLYEYTKRKLTL